MNEDGVLEHKFITKTSRESKDVTVSLSGNDWSSADDSKSRLFFSGYLSKGVQIVRTADELLPLLTSESSDYLPSIVEVLRQANGNFAFILIRDNQLIAATDLIRSIPLYIVSSDKNFLLTDSVAFGCHPTVSDRLYEFASMQYTMGKNTVYTGTEALRPAEYLILTPGSLPQRHRYFRFIYNPETESRLTDEQLKEKFDEVMLSAFLRMVKSAPKDTQWAIPLSGGFDSRLIVNYLKRLNVENILCYSYGVPGNSQSVISEKVAIEAGYSHEFVTYTEKKWGALHQNGLFDSYIQFAFNGDSLPHFQDFLAVYELKEKGHIDKNTIFVPGHQLGFLSDFVSKDDKDFQSTEEVANAVLRKNTKFDLHENHANRIRRQVRLQIQDNKIPLRSYMEYFLWENRHCKFTANSVRVYEFFGCRWRMPYWDRSMVDFWLSIDFEKRTDQNFYKKMVRSSYIIPQIRSIPFTDDKTPDHRRLPVGFTKRLRSIRTNRFSDLLISVIFGKKKHVGEGLTQMYATRASRIGQLLGPIDLWPKDIRPAILKIKNRHTTRINYHVLTALYTIYKLLKENLKKV